MSDSEHFDDVDAQDMKALRQLMFRVTSKLHQSGALDSEERQELLDLASEATAWEADSDTEPEGSVNE